MTSGVSSSNVEHYPIEQTQQLVNNITVNAKVFTNRLDLCLYKDPQSKLLACRTIRNVIAALHCLSIPQSDNLRPIEFINKRDIKGATNFLRLAEKDLVKLEHRHTALLARQNTK